MDLDESVVAQTRREIEGILKPEQREKARAMADAVGIGMEIGRANHQDQVGRRDRPTEAAPWRRGGRSRPHLPWFR